MSTEERAVSEEIPACSAPKNRNGLLPQDKQNKPIRTPEGFILLSEASHRLQKSMWAGNPIRCAPERQSKLEGRDVWSKGLRKRPNIKIAEVEKASIEWGLGGRSRKVPSTRHSRESCGLLTRRSKDPLHPHSPQFYDGLSRRGQPP